MTDIYNLTNLTSSYSAYDFMFNLNLLTDGLLFICLLIILFVILYVNYQSVDNVMGFYIATFIITIICGIGTILGFINLSIFKGLAVVLVILTIYVYNKGSG